ncbi:MAG TPA: hypothetical protein VL134_00790 [Leptolyngbya sp.]|jgi:hypothetical protein|nr:hypothetical protein [Leptolyngbya sp.]
MSIDRVGVKPGTRNLKGYFIQQTSGYQLVEMHQSGWAIICSSEAVCHYVDPENLQISRERDLPSVHEF